MLLIHVFARVRHLIRGLLSCFICVEVLFSSSGIRLISSSDFGSFEQLFVEMHREKTILYC